jgi:hypothetical protein
MTAPAGAAAEKAMVILSAAKDLAGRQCARFFAALRMTVRRALPGQLAVPAAWFGVPSRRASTPAKRPLLKSPKSVAAPQKNLLTTTVGL